MRKKVLVTAVGEDRPGIVARLTEVYVKHGANLEDSRMAILGGEFAAIMLVSVADESLESLKKDLGALKDETITVSTKLTESMSPEKFSSHSSYELSVTGADHEGIVHTVTRFLSERSINIHSMETDVTNAPETGTPLFRMRAVILVPDTVTHRDLQSQLAKVGDQESVDISVNTCKVAQKATAATR